MVPKELQKRMEEILRQCNNLIEEIGAASLYNEQEVLDWLDKLNELSISY